MSTIEAILVLALGAAFYWGYLRFKAEKAAKAEQTVEDVIEEIESEKTENDIDKIENPEVTE